MSTRHISADRWRRIRETEKELVGVSATVVDCGKPKWTFAFDTQGNLKSVGAWDSDGNMGRTEDADSFIELLAEDDRDILAYLLGLVRMENSAR